MCSPALPIGKAFRRLSDDGGHVFRYGDVVFTYNRNFCQMTVISADSAASVANACSALLGHVRHEDHPSVIVVAERRWLAPVPALQVRPCFKRYHVSPLHPIADVMQASTWLPQSAWHELLKTFVGGLGRDASWGMVVFERRARDDDDGPVIGGRELFHGPVTVSATCDTREGDVVYSVDCTCKLTATGRGGLVYDFDGMAWFRDARTHLNDVYLHVTVPVAPSGGVPDDVLLTKVRLNKVRNAGMTCYGGTRIEAIDGYGYGGEALDLTWTKRVRVSSGDTAFARMFPREHPQWLAVLHRIREARARETAASVIQSQWRRCVSDPAFAVCRERLRDEFDRLTMGQDRDRYDADDLRRRRALLHPGVRP